MDIFVYPTQRLLSPDETLLHIRGGRVLFERGTLGGDFLASLERIHSQPPTPLPSYEVEARRMLQRAARGDIEGNYRRVWLLTQLLEDYFAMRGRRYPGSKEAFKDLAVSDPQALKLFKTALEPVAALDSIAAVAAHVHGRLPEASVQ